MSSEPSPVEYPCPIAAAVLSALQQEYDQRIELHDPTIEDMLATLHTRLRDARPEDHCFDERSSRTMRLMTYAVAESARLARPLGIEFPEEEIGKSELFENLMEACHFDTIEIKLRETPGAGPLRQEHVLRAKAAFTTGRAIVQSSIDRLRAPKNSPEELSHARACGAHLAVFFKEAEVPFNLRLVYASWLLESRHELDAFLVQLNALPKPE